MMHNLHNLASAIAIFFIKTSLINMDLEYWQPYISANLIAYESQSANDPAFIAIILIDVDTQVNCWLSDCTNKHNRCNVDDELIDFSNLHCSIKVRQFQFYLPSSIRYHISSSSCRRIDDRNEGGDGKNGGDNKITPVQNPKRNSR